MIRGQIKRRKSTHTHTYIVYVTKQRDGGKKATENSNNGKKHWTNSERNEWRKRRHLSYTKRHNGQKVVKWNSKIVMATALSTACETHRKLQTRSEWGKNTSRQQEREKNSKWSVIKIWCEEIYDAHYVVSVCLQAGFIFSSSRV